MLLVLLVLLLLCCAALLVLLELRALLARPALLVPLVLVLRAAHLKCWGRGKRRGDGDLWCVCQGRRCCC